MATCTLCLTAMDDRDVLHHLRILHPDAWGDGMDTWPDGSPVVVDTTLEPEDFGGAS